MVRLLLITSSVLLALINTSTVFGQKFGFQKVLENNPDRITTFCVPNNDYNIKTLDNQGVNVKFSSNEWLFISATPRWINETMKAGELTDFYFEMAPPSLMADSARMHHFVNEVHAGTGGLGSSYTGAGILLGFVDSGIEVAHPDFQEANGDTRILRYWDQTMPDNASSPPGYGYGFVWDSTDINAGLVTSVDNSGHGSSVAGQAAGNGLANGTNKGMAPDCKIIMVETDFSRPNWTLTVADACDYIFKVADTLGMPCVINLSVGSYFGSHDGNDPASIAMENLLDAKTGRIIVAAAGNSGGQPGYHQRGNPTTDTNFVWFVNNPSGSLGANTVFFDLWTDVVDANWDFAFGVNNQAPGYSDRGRTNFHGATSSIGTTIFDTVWNGSNRLATIEVYTSVSNGLYNMQFIARLDSVNGYYRFETTGSGNYDLWSGQWAGFNNMVTAAPSAAVFPDSMYYVAPDNLQSIVSSWNCSEKVISVANMRNRQGHINRNYAPYINLTTPVGDISPNSSRGPNRNDVVKPDITAAGDVSLGAGPIWMLSNPAYNTLIDSGGWHVRNGGTSMASPVVAGIACLYLERCDGGTYQNYKDDVITGAYTDAYTGAVPNFSFGFGKIHALNTLLELTFPATPTITNDWTTSTLTSSAENTYQWSLDGTELTGETSQDLIAAAPYGTYTVTVTNTDGCDATSAPMVVTLSVTEVTSNAVTVHPNPTEANITIQLDEEVKAVMLIDQQGKQIQLDRVAGNSFSLQHISNGAYTLLIETNDGQFQSKVIRL